MKTALMILLLTYIIISIKYKSCITFNKIILILDEINSYYQEVYIIFYMKTIKFPSNDKIKLTFLISLVVFIFVFISILDMVSYNLNYLLLI